ncbi:unnamed protein product [Plutella xylostella]|uniref:(diamondback moth) hypothetical protein n=1 Tax=Plutella xylostella TaxID=51655 RepID=A0A8S4ESM8_PLUXY|nr:unnamed protein product [Plutella xylostella]
MSSGSGGRLEVQHARKINSSFWCVRENVRARGGAGAGPAPRAEAAALRAPAPALRSAARRVLSPRARAPPRRAGRVATPPTILGLGAYHMKRGGGERSLRESVCVSPGPAMSGASPGPRSPASPARSPPPAVLHTMTPVPAHDYYPHKVELDSDDGYPPERYRPAHQLAAYAPENKVPGQPDVYDQAMDSIDEKTPIDLIYEDDKQTVIYTTTPDQKRVEMISGQMEDGQLVSGGQLVDGGVSVVVGAPGQPGTVLVLADHVVDELGQVITIPR